LLSTTLPVVISSPVDRITARSIMLELLLVH
jgi:hypothetical protein